MLPTQDPKWKISRYAKPNMTKRGCKMKTKKCAFEIHIHLHFVLHVCFVYHIIVTFHFNIENFMQKSWPYENAPNIQRKLTSTDNRSFAAQLFWKYPPPFEKHQYVFKLEKIHFSFECTDEFICSVQYHLRFPDIKCFFLIWNPFSFGRGPVHEMPWSWKIQKKKTKELIETWILVWKRCPTCICQKNQIN